MFRSVQNGSLIEQLAAAQPANVMALMLKLLQEQQKKIDELETKQTNHELWKRKSEKQVLDLEKQLQRLMSTDAAPPTVQKAASRQAASTLPITKRSSVVDAAAIVDGDEPPVALSRRGSTESTGSGDRSFTKNESSSNLRESSEPDPEELRRRQAEAKQAHEQAMQRKKEHGNYALTIEVGAPTTPVKKTFTPTKAKAPVLPIPKPKSEEGSAGRRRRQAPEGPPSDAGRLGTIVSEGDAAAAAEASPKVVVVAEPAAKPAQGSAPAGAPEPAPVPEQPHTKRLRGRSGQWGAIGPLALQSPLRIQTPTTPKGSKLGPPAEEEAVSSIAIADDGITMVSATDAGWLQLWSREADAGTDGWRTLQRTRACTSEVNGLALRGSLLLSAAADGRLRAWRLEGIGATTADKYLFELRTLRAPPGAPGVADGEQGLMCAALPPLARPTLTRQDTAGAEGKTPPSGGGLGGGGGDGGGGGGSGGGGSRRGSEDDVPWAACGGLDGHVSVCGTQLGEEVQRLKLAQTDDGWVMSVVAGYDGAGGALLVAGTFEGQCVLHFAPPLQSGRQPIHPSFPHQPFFVARRLFVGRDPEKDGVLSVALCDGLGIAAAGTNDGTLRLWDVRDPAGSSPPAVVTPPADAEGGLSSVAWRVASSSARIETAELLSGAEDGSCARWAISRDPSGGGPPSCEQLQVLQAGGEVLNVACGAGGSEAYCAMREAKILPLAHPPLLHDEDEEGARGG